MDPAIIKSFNVTSGDILCSTPFIKNTFIAGGTSGGTVMLFPFSGNKSRRLVGHRAAINCICVSTHPLCLATGCEDATVRIWQIRGNDDSCITIEPNDGSIRAIAISPNADRLLVAGRLSNPSLWNPFDKSQSILTFDHHESLINAVALSTQTSIAVTGASDGRCRIFDIQNGDFLKQVDCYSPITALSLNSDGTKLAIGTAVGSAFMVDVETGQIIHSARLHNQDITSIMIQPFGNLLLSGSNDNSVILTDLNTFEPIYTLNIHKDKVIDVHFSTDGEQFTTASIDHKIYVWTAPDMTAHETNQSSDVEEEDDEGIPEQKAPPLPEPHYSDQSVHESDKLSAYLQSPSPVKQFVNGKQAKNQKNESSPEVYGLSELSEPSTSSVKDRFGKQNERKKTKNVVSCIKQTPGTKELSPDEDEFLTILKQCESEMSIIAKKLLELGDKIKGNDEKIAHIEAVQVSRAEIAQKKPTNRRRVEKK